MKLWKGGSWLKEEELVRLITDQVVKELSQRGNDRHIPIALSNRHLHLCQKDFEQLFGSGCSLTKLRDLSQPGQFAAKETVKLVGPKGIIENVRILGPIRDHSQAELSISDGYRLGIELPIRISGDLDGTPGCVIAGPQGVVQLTEGLICAQRHIHMSPEDGLHFGVQDKAIVRVHTFGSRALIFDQVMVRISSTYRLEMHVDIEEGNAAGVHNGDFVEILKEG